MRSIIGETTSILQPTRQHDMFAFGHRGAEFPLFFYGAKSALGPFLVWLGLRGCGAGHGPGKQRLLLWAKVSGPDGAPFQMPGLAGFQVA